MPELTFTSSLSAVHRDDVERLLFFNPNQARVAASVLVVVKRYGVPRLRVQADRVSIAVEPHEPQTLFVVERDAGEQYPVGLAVYLREGDKLVVLFVAVDETYVGRGQHGDVGLLRRIVDELGAIAGRVRGVATLEVYFGRATPTRIPVKRRAR